MNKYIEEWTALKDGLELSSKINQAVYKPLKSAH